VIRDLLMRDRVTAQRLLSWVVNLMRDGTDVNLQDNSGRTPLSWAAERGHETVIRELLMQDGVIAQYGQTLLSWVVNLMVNLMRDETNVNLSDNSGRTPLSWAAERGHETVIRELLMSSKVNINLKDNSERTALWWAEQNSHEAVVSLLSRGIESTSI